jgi:hypothetical protein
MIKMQNLNKIGINKLGVANRIFILGLLFIVNINGFAQKKTETEKRDEKNKEKNIDGNRYRVFNNYINFGMGVGRAFNNSTITLPVHIDYNFRVNNNMFQVGYFRSEMPILWGSYTENFVNDLHFGFNLRRENKKLNRGLIIGPSVNFGLKNNVSFLEPGVYASAQLIRKVFYDVGFGLSVFANYNRAYAFAGSRLEIYLSSSYKGKINQ